MIAAVQFWGSPEAVVYKVLFVVHIAAVVLAFGPVFVQPMLARLVRQGSGGNVAVKLGADITRRYTLPGLVVAALAGLLMSVGSGGAYGMDQPWISASFAVVLFVLMLLWFLVLPTHAALAEASGDAAAKLAARLSMTTGFVHIGFVMIVVLMIWKPA